MCLPPQGKAEEALAALRASMALWWQPDSDSEDEEEGGGGGAGKKVGGQMGGRVYAFG